MLPRFMCHETISDAEFHEHSSLKSPFILVCSFALFRTEAQKNIFVLSKDHFSKWNLLNVHKTIPTHCELKQIEWERIYNRKQSPHIQELYM